ncbi:hypothetical protein YC2023_071787 [Brassica napus]
MSRRARRSLQNLGREPGRSGRRTGTWRLTATLGSPETSAGIPERGPAAGRAPHVAWCPVHSRRPLKIRRTESRSRPVVLITASGLQGEQPLGSRQNGSVTSGKGLALRAGLGGPSSEPVDCWRAA